MPRRPILNDIFRFRVMRWALVVALGAASVLVSVAPVLAAPPLPALVDPPSHQRHVGKMIFAQLVTPDLVAAERFYGALFGWTFRDARVGTRRFGAALLDGRLIAGIVQKPLPADGHRQSAWLTFLAAGDTNAVSRTAIQDGATLLAGPRDIPNFGREALLADPQGAIFAILASSSGDPPDVLAVPGAWIWSALMTADPAKDAEFYRAVFGYDTDDVPAESAGHIILVSETYARASVNSLPASRPDAPSRWLNYLRVDDAAATAAKALALGGHVLVSPRLDRHGGRIAVLSDPMGAPFGLMEWPGAANAGAAK